LQKFVEVLVWCNIISQSALACCGQQAAVRDGKWGKKHETETNRTVNCAKIRTKNWNHRWFCKTTTEPKTTVFWSSFANCTPL